MPFPPFTPAPIKPPSIGILPLPDGGTMARFWAPRCETLAIRLIDGPTFALASDERGWWHAVLPSLPPGQQYRLLVDGRREIPDPCSRFQPEGVHGPSAIVDLKAFNWTDARWSGVPLTDLVVYEVHIGTFSQAGTCAALISHLDDLAELGITAIELMPVAQCPGIRNWGYDVAFPFAVQHSLGGPQGLQRLVDACHQRGLGVILDVVYNHLGPEGAHLEALMPFTTDEHRTPWGAAVNVDGRESDGVRALLLANAWQWLIDFHIDGLRLDAAHLIPAGGARPFLTQLATEVGQWAQSEGRPLHLIAEAGINASRFVRDQAHGGYGLDCQWSDDFHHALHALITGERQPPSSDFGTVEDLRRAFARGFIYDGRWCESRQQTWGDEAADLPTHRFMVCAQNHDHIGNRPFGDRLSRLTDAAGLRCAAGAVLLSPYLPLLFMGEEWGERSPFLFFVDHDPALRDAVRADRRHQFAAIFGDAEPPDPFDPATLAACRLDHAAARGEPGRRLRAWYAACLRVRRELPSLRLRSREEMSILPLHASVIALERRCESCRTLLLLNPTATLAHALPLPAGTWRVVLSSHDPAWGGPGWSIPENSVLLELPPWSVVLLRDQPDTPSPGST